MEIGATFLDSEWQKTATTAGDDDTNQTVTVPSEDNYGGGSRGYAAFKVADPGAILKLTIQSGKDKDGKDTELVESSIVPADTGDKDLWSPSSKQGPGPHVYTSGVILSSREWLHVRGTYKPAGSGGGGGGGEGSSGKPFDVDVPAVDIDIAGLEEKDEESVGGIVILNNDDDDANQTPDKEDTAAVANENDLVKITLRKVQPEGRFPSGTVTLAASAGGEKIKLWESATKGGTPITLPKEYETSTDLPKDIWVEGIAASAAPRDVGLKVSYPTPDGKTAEDSLKLTLLPVEILIPELKKDASGQEVYTGKLVSASKLAIGTLENSFESTTAHPLKTNWIDEDPDRFYIRITDPGHSGRGPIKVRLWTDSDGTEYDDDNRSSADSEVVELIEDGSTGIFTSKSLLLTSNDGDDDHPVDGVADDAKNDRTRKIALGGKVKVEFLEYKPAATYNADIEVPVPVEKTVKVKVWVPMISGNAVVPDARVDLDYKRMRETLAQVGVAVVRNETIVKFNHTDAGIDLSPSGFDYNGSLVGTDEYKALFDWIAQYSQRAADEISIIYVNFTTTNYLSYGDNGPAGFSYIAKAYSPAKYANHIVISVSQEKMFTAPHELLHILMNAEHGDYSTEYNHNRMTFHHTDPEIAGIEGRKRISRRLFGKQKNAIIASPYAK